MVIKISTGVHAVSKMATRKTATAITFMTGPVKIMTGPAAVSKLRAIFKNIPPDFIAMPFAISQVAIKIMTAMAAVEKQGPAVSTRVA